jgi:branched-subunit amino acid ABC-type transport system permease component
MHLFVLSLGFGLVTASVLALASVGLTLQFGVTNYVNFAYGDFLTLGA